MQIIDNDKLSQAKVNKEFFPFLHVENIFSDEVDSELIIKDFPKKPNIDPTKGKKTIAYSIYPFIPWISSTLIEPLFL